MRYFLVRYFIGNHQNTHPFLAQPLPVLAAGLGLAVLVAETGPLPPGVTPVLPAPPHAGGGGGLHLTLSAFLNILKISYPTSG